MHRSKQLHEETFEEAVQKVQALEVANLEQQSISGEKVPAETPASCQAINGH